MSDQCSQQLGPDDLDDVIFGKASPTKHARITRHAAACAPCKHELAWLRAERRLFTERAQREPLAPPEFRDFARYRGIRQAAPLPDQATASAQRRWWPMASGLAAAALLLLIVSGREAFLPVDGASAGGRPHVVRTVSDHHRPAPPEMTFTDRGFTPASYSDPIDEICESRHPAVSSASFEGASWSDARGVSEQPTSAAGFTSGEQSSCVAHPSGAICDSGS